MRLLKHVLIIVVLLTGPLASAQLLQVKEGKNAIVKEEPTGNGNHITRLEAGTQVANLGSTDRYYFIQLNDGRTGYSYKGNYIEVEGSTAGFPSSTQITKENLLIRKDVLKIVVIDVEVGDATLIICPVENGERDVILIDTGVNDADRIKEELISNGFTLANSPINRFFATHYDRDHIGDAEKIAPLTKVVYDLGGPIKQYPKTTSFLDRRTITLNYEETFSGGVTIECVAANNATDFEPNRVKDKDKNTNSIALIVSYNGFDYFTAGDLTISPEKSLASGIRDCDVYHVNHHGSSVTSSYSEFIEKLNPEVSVVSNGHLFNHPTDVVAQRIIATGSKFFQTNINPDDKAHHPNYKYIGDNTYHAKSKDENAEGATGSINVVVGDDNYYVVMPQLPLEEGTFLIER